jgi:protein TonB
MSNSQFYGPAAAPAPDTPTRRPGMNLQLSEAQLAKFQAPEFSIKGKVGADWKEAFTRWVNEHKYYPRAAIELGQQGRSTIHLVVHADGSITGLRLLKSAGSSFLDEAWLDLFRDVKVPPFPPGTKAKKVEIVATMHYELIR